MNAFERRFLQQIRVRALVGGNDRLLLAVSGGPDSMALLHLCLAVSEAIHCTVAVAHCNFRLRGRESDLDEKFVRDECSRLGVECFCRSFSTLETSREWKKSIEETARIERYSYFDSLMEEHNFSLLATGHHVNDNAETMLFNLFRGVTLPSLKGIRAKHGKIIRPLLLLDKKEIMDYLTGKGIIYRTDESNLGTVHDRNFIRHKVIPLIEERFKSKLMPSLQRLSEHAAELEEFLEGHFEELLAARPDLRPGSGSLNVDEMMRLSVFERKEILKRVLQEHDVAVDSKVLQRLADLLSLQRGKSVPLGNSLVAVRKAGLLCFEPAEGY